MTRAPDTPLPTFLGLQLDGHASACTWSCDPAKQRTWTGWGAATSHLQAALAFQSQGGALEEAPQRALIAHRHAVLEYLLAGCRHGAEAALLPHAAAGAAPLTSRPRCSPVLGLVAVVTSCPHGSPVWGAVAGAQSVSTAVVGWQRLLQGGKVLCKPALQSCCRAECIHPCCWR